MTVFSTIRRSGGHFGSINLVLEEDGRQLKCTTIMSGESNMSASYQHFARLLADNAAVY